MNELRTPEECVSVAPSMSRIGLVAYCALPPNHVFVRVPNEPGRWMLVHRCVVDVACGQCKAVEGEPCKRGPNYGVGTHVARRTAHQVYRKWHRPLLAHKPRIRESDISEAEGAMA